MTLCKMFVTEQTGPLKLYIRKNDMAIWKKNECINELLNSSLLQTYLK